MLITMGDSVNEPVMFESCINALLIFAKGETTEIDLEPFEVYDAAQLVKNVSNFFNAVVSCPA
jgi:hypothetical protein